MVGHDTGNIRTYVHRCWLSVVVVFALWLASRHYHLSWSWSAQHHGRSRLGVVLVCCVGGDR